MGAGPPRTSAARAAVGLLAARAAVGLLAALAAVGLLAAVMVGPGAPPAGARTAGGHGAATYSNPVEPDDAPDPDVVVDHGTYYAFTTGSLNGPIQLFISTDLSHWTATPWPGALVQDATWTKFGKEWAPSVIEVGLHWLLYYATEDTATGAQCVTVAVSDSVTGPYVNESGAPLACDAIDPSAYRSPSGALYLVWSTGGGAGSVAELESAPLSADGRSFLPASTPVVLATNDQPWESTIENPDLFTIGDSTYLLFSGGSYENATYATGYAVCDGPLGPCTQSPANPILSSTLQVIGPGGAAAFADDAGRWWVAYAAAAPGRAEHGFGGIRVRSLRLAPLCADGIALSIPAPTVTPQPRHGGCPPSGGHPG